MLELLEAPTDFITLDDAKKHVEAPPSRDNTMIAAMVKSAISYLDGPNGYLGAAIAPQKWRWKTGAFCNLMRFPLGPVLTVESVKYTNFDGVLTTVSPADYYLFGDAESPYVRPIAYWPTDVQTRDDAVAIEFTAGRALIPPQLKSAALLIVGQLYLHREIDVDVRLFPTTFSMFDLAHPFRVSL